MTALALLTRYCGVCLADGAHVIATDEIADIPLCKPCAELYGDRPELLPPVCREPVEVREPREWDTSQTDRIWACSRSTHPAFIPGPPRVMLFPTQRFALHMIELAFHDARLCKWGTPIVEALRAYRWILNDAPEAPGFLWCCGWIEDSPEVIRREGMRGRWSRSRLGGIREIELAWEEAAAAYQARGGIVDWKVARLTRLRDAFLRREFRRTTPEPYSLRV